MLAPHDPPGTAEGAAPPRPRLPLPGLWRSVRPGASHPSLGARRPHHALESRFALSPSPSGRPRGGLPGRSTNGWRASLPPPGRPASGRGPAASAGTRRCRPDPASATRGGGACPASSDRDAGLAGRAPERGLGNRRLASFGEVDGMARKAKPPAGKSVDALRHREATRRNIPTAEYQSVIQKEAEQPLRAAYERRNRDLDPQLVWCGKDQQDWSDLVVQAPPLYIQEKVHPKALIDDLLRQTRESRYEAGEAIPDLFADFNGIPTGVDKTEFYQHDQNWSNRMILGDSLQVMASLAEREGLRGKVQCIYLDPPYGIKFNSNFQWSTTSRDVKDGNAEHITREPEQVKAFRDTWRDGIHSYLTYLRDRLTVARDLLADSGSIFVQIGDENVHRVRAVMDEVFGDENFITLITVWKTSSQTSTNLASTGNFLLFYAKNKELLKFRNMFLPSGLEQDVGNRFTRVQTDEMTRRTMNSQERAHDPYALRRVRVYRHDNLTSQSGGETTSFNYEFQRILFHRDKGFWKTNLEGMNRLKKAWRLGYPTQNSLAYVRFIDDFPVTPVTDLWTDTQTGAFTEEKLYVVQTNTKVMERCIMLTTDPGDLVLDPTCGSGTTAYVAEQWGRRWITIDTSRVALALARARIMGARYPFYLLADSRDGQLKEAEVTRAAPSSQPVHGNIRHGFVYERVPHITLKSIANNAEIDVIWDKWETKLEPLRESLNKALKKTWQEWEIPRELDEQSRARKEAVQLHA